MHAKIIMESGNSSKTLLNFENASGESVRHFDQTISGNLTQKNSKLPPQSSHADEVLALTNRLQDLEVQLQRKDETM